MSKLSSSSSYQEYNRLVNAGEPILGLPVRAPNGEGQFEALYGERVCRLPLFKKVFNDEDDEVPEQTGLCLHASGNTNNLRNHMRSQMHSEWELKIVGGGSGGGVPQDEVEDAKKFYVAIIKEHRARAAQQQEAAANEPFVHGAGGNVPLQKDRRHVAWRQVNHKLKAAGLGVPCDSCITQSAKNDFVNENCKYWGFFTNDQEWFGVD